MTAIESKRSNDYHDYVPPKEHPRIMGLNNIDPYVYSYAITSSDIIQPIIAQWKQRLEEPFKGVTNDGKKKENLFYLEDEDAPTSAAVEVATVLLKTLSPEESSKATYQLDDEQWRKWCNPEFVVFDVGLRLEHLEGHKQDLIMLLLKSALSDQGYRKVIGAIKTNVFLGEICNARAILNAGSYFFMIFGTPSPTGPWGFSFFGHHTCLNFFFLDKQMTISPVFIGAEPNIIDQGPENGLEVCVREEERGLRFMQSLPHELQKEAQLYAAMHDPAMPEDRWNPADQRHLGGAFQDNRVIPYEGVNASQMTVEQQEALIDVVASFLEILPPGSITARLAQLKRHIHETYFCWIGGYSDEDSFYYRIQSPVICVEFDHHSGVFLTNKDPKKYHIHTVIRTPNGNDYGREWLRQYREKYQS